MQNKRFIEQRIVENDLARYYLFQSYNTPYNSVPTLRAAQDALTPFDMIPTARTNGTKPDSFRAELG